MIRILVFLFCFPMVLLAQSYLWPTNASTYISSSFCEYRPGHYHAAIDVKTWNREGYPCYAVADGHITRVRVSPFGYGKVLYLKLDDGNYAVYAHLQSFSPELDLIIRNKQLEAQTYTVSWSPKHWPVKKGDIIAYTGQTGIGVPHLHFEIRDPKHRPVNPLQFYPHVVKDRQPPVLKAVLLIPMNHKSRVNGSFMEKPASVHLDSRGVYRLEEPVRVYGTVGIAINGYDLADGVYNKFGFYKTELFVDGQPAFSIVYDTLDYALTEQIDVETVYSRWVNEKTVFHKLFIDPFNTLEFYDRKLGDGLIRASTSPVSFRIQVSDYFGNLRTVEGQLLPDLAGPSRLQVIRQDSRSVLLMMTLPENLEALAFRTSMDGRRWKDVEYFEVIEHQLSNPVQRMLIKLNLPREERSCLEADIQTADSQVFRISTRFNESINEIPYHAKLDVINKGKFLFLQFSRIFDVDHLALAIDGETTYPTVSEGRFEHVIPASKLASGQVHVRLENAKSVLCDTTLHYNTLFPFEKKTVNYDQGNFVLSTTTGSLYDTLLMQCVFRNEDRLSDSIPLHSRIYQVLPHDQKLRNPVEIHMRYDGAFSDPRKLGIYTLNGNGKINYAGASRDSLTKTVSVRTERFGSFFIAADTTLPVIQILYPQTGSVIKKLDEIRLTVSDTHSGIPDEQSLKVTLDGQFVLPEWDPEEKIIRAFPHFPVLPGDHSLEIRATDAAGNTQVKRLFFSIQ